MKKEYSVQEIAIKLNISETEVRRIEKRAIEKISRLPFGKILKEYLEEN